MERSDMRIILKLKLKTPLTGSNQTELSIIFHHYQSLIRFLQNSKSSLMISKITKIEEY
jgi:hypothetical protein